MSIATAARSVETTPASSVNGRSPVSWALLVPDDADMLYEVVDGKVVEKTVGTTELEIAAILVEFLGPFARLHRLGKVFSEMIFRIDQTRDLQRRPDVAFVSDDRWPMRRRIPKGAAWDMVPDLAIEVVSQSNTADEVMRKIHEYFDAGVKGVWIVYPRQQEIYIYTSTIQIQVLQLGQELDGGDLIPGFRLPLAKLFEDDPE